MERLVYTLLFLPPILFALTIHEYLHGYVAWRMGDPTAKFAGRLTFNPIKHIDILGLIAFVIFRFGWAKPVPINPDNFYDIKKGVLYTSIAGPASNFLAAIPFGLVVRILPTSLGVLMPLRIMLEAAVVFNLIFCAFNLIPIPPLDGSHVLFHFLPPQYSHIEYWMTRYGFFLLIGLILLNNLTGGLALWGWIGPFVRFFGTLFAGRITLM
jgi:Zn-dependent protease